MQYLRSLSNGYNNGNIQNIENIIWKNIQIIDSKYGWLVLETMPTLIKIQQL